jgi:PAS domain S-box-containing protein
MKKRKPAPAVRDRLQELRGRLRTAEDTLRAIRAGEVDALVVSKARGEQVVTLAGAELPYRIMFDQMYEAAVTLTPDGMIAYCNRRFSEIVRMPHRRIIGLPLRQFVPEAEQAALEALRKGAGRRSTRGELRLQAGDGSAVPVSISFAPLQLKETGSPIGVIGVAADISDLKRAEELRAGLARQVMTAQDDERRRIARELHDETGQSLTGLLVGLRTLETSGTMDEAVELAQQLRGIAAQSLENLRSLVSGLHPSILDELGISVAVTRHVQQVAKLHGLAVELRIDGLESGGLPPLVQNTVYRVLQEALTNVVKHSGARIAHVELTREPVDVELRVRDEGIGIQPEAASGAAGQRPGLGLRGMGERAALLGGSVQVESFPGRGTTITCRIPLEGAPVAPRRRVSARLERTR